MDMNSTPSAVALTQVLAVPELLENILSFLPEREILTSVQRVSQTWRSSIIASPRIQRKLFLLKGKKPAVSPIRSIDDDLDEQVFGWSVYHTSVATNRLLEGFHTLYPDCRLSYMVEGRDFLARQPGVYSIDHWIHVETYPDGETAFSHDPSLSWRKMQLCDPPITTVSFEARSGADPGLPSVTDTYATLFDQNGVTLGQAYETAAAALRSFVGEDDPKIAWRFQLRFGIGFGAPLHVPESESDNVSDDESTDWGLTSDEGSEEEEEEDSADDESGKDTQAKESAESTMSKVLAIPELLENILCFLPEREILTSVQRVSQTWRAAILDSPSIQRKLFSPKGNNHAALPAWFSTIDPLGGQSKRFQRFGIPMYKGPMTTNGFFQKDTGRDGMEEVDDLYLYKSCDLRLMDGF
jgi:hypothetical protein